jgi:signal transduction histidine kinase/ActR/RegA family two-component response regulator
MQSEQSRAVLDFLHGILCAPAGRQPDLREFLAGLARAFGARATGLANLADGVSQVYFGLSGETTPASQPWQDDPALLVRAREAQTALRFTAADTGLFLLTAICHSESTGWLLWVEGAGQAGWGDPEAAALALAGQVLAQRLVAAGERPRWAAQLERLARQRQLEAGARLTRNLAHDFGNVLTGILGFNELALSEKLPVNSTLRKYLAEVQQGAQRGKEFVDRLRVFAGNRDPAPACCDLAAVLAEVAAGQAEVDRALPTDLPLPAIDRENLRLVLGALLNNAREAVAAVGKGTIRVSARSLSLTEADCLDLYGASRPGPAVEITVVDDGRGLTADAERLLFAQPFFSTKLRHLGMGLALTFGILRVYRGGLSIRSRAEGGTVARLVLPVAAPRVSAVAGAKEGGATILVVDDDHQIRAYVRAALEQAGFRVRAAAGVEEAFAAYVTAIEPFGLVISDVLMADGSGVDLARRLFDHDREARVLLMSGQVGPAAVGTEFPGRIVDLLAKPFRPEALLELARATMERAALHPAQTGTSGGGFVVSSSR